MVVDQNFQTGYLANMLHNPSVTFKMQSFRQRSHCIIQFEKVIFLKKLKASIASLFELSIEQLVYNLILNALIIWNLQVQDLSSISFNLAILWTDLHMEEWTSDHKLFKVRIFWEGHKIWKNLPLKIWHYWVAFDFMWKIFSNFVAFSEYLKFNKKYSV